MQRKHKKIKAISVMISFLLILGLIQTGVQAKISVSDAYEIKQSNKENSEKWQNTDKVGGTKNQQNKNKDHAGNRDDRKF